jgi:L-idonate 5-dehydrogenase
MMPPTEKSNMGAVLHGAEDLRYEPVAHEKIAPGKVRLKLGAAGICGSDQHYFRHGRMGKFVLQSPVALGHEMSGDVIEVGPGVKGLSVGDRVVVDPALVCGQCEPCRQGRANLCKRVKFMGSASHRPHLHGGMREEFVVEDSRCVAVPSNVDHELLAFSEPLSVALHATARAGDLLGRDVMIAGGGTIGSLIAACARSAGARCICVSDPSNTRRNIALKMGATETINPEERTWIDACDADGGLFDVTFEASGHPSAFEDVVRCTRAGGKAVLVGMIPTMKCQVPFNHMTIREIDLISTFRQNGVFSRAVSMLVNGQINPRPIHSGTFPLADVRAAFNASFDQKSHIKVLLKGPALENG